MAKKITVEFTDAEFAELQKVYSSADASAAEAVIKNKFINFLKGIMKAYDENQARKRISYTSFDPK